MTDWRIGSVCITKIIEEDNPMLVIGTRFSPPTAGHIVKDGATYKLKC